MPAQKLGLYDLLAPEFLLGFNFPGHIDQYLKLATIDELRAAHDDTGIVYTGRIGFGGSGAAAPTLQHRDPSGKIFDWQDVSVDFRLTLPRQGATFIQTAANALPSQDLKNLLADFGAPAGPSDYPGIRFRLELLLNLVTFHMGSSWVPGKLGDDYRVIPDPALQGEDVKFVLPKMVFVYEQENDLSKPPGFRMKSWGNSGFDAPSDLAEGELIRMEPPIALHTSGRVAFGVDQIILDLSEDSTPPEILAHFGADESFEGLYIKAVRVYYSDANKGWAFNISVNDCLISFAGEVSLEAELDIIGPQAAFHVNVHLYDGARDLAYTHGTAADPNHPNTLTGGAATIPNTGVVQVEVIGGVPPFTIHVRLDGTELWSDTARQAPISPGAPGTLHPAGSGTLVITVDDAQSGPNANHFSQTIALTITAAAAPDPDPNGTTADRPAPQGARQNAVLTPGAHTPDPLPAGYGLAFTPSSSGTAERVIVQGAPPSSVTVNGSPMPVGSDQSVGFDVPDGATVNLAVTWPGAAAQSETFNLYFDYQHPDPDHWPASEASYLANSPQPLDARFVQSTAPSGASSRTGADALRDWINTRLVAPRTVTVDAYASYEDHPDKADYNQSLSARRRQVAVDIIGALATVGGGTPHGQTDAQTAVQGGDASHLSNPDDRVVRITGQTTAASPAATLQATVARPARPAPTPQPTTPVVHPSPTPQPPQNKPPDWFHRISLRLRLERNVPVLVEVFGEVDIETPTEARLRNAAPGHAGDGLGLQNRAGASSNPNPQDGVIDFKVNVTYDTATRLLTETLTLGAAPGDRDGLVRGEYTRGNPPSVADRFRDIAGAVLVFMPIVNNAAADVAADPGSAGNWVKLGVELAAPVAIGGLGVFQTKALTLYGGELRLRQALPAGSDPAKFTDAGVLLDYGVEFGIDLSIGSLHIQTSRPLKVRYKAIGFNFHFDNGTVKYQAIFDTSRGYELDLSDPGLFNLPSPLGDIIKILGARVARVNPLTLEVDLGLKVDLGVVTVDRFKIKWPLDPFGVPTILPTGVRVDISSVVVGSGHVNMLPDGFEGSLDVSIVPVKVRVAASLGVRNITQGARKATAVFAGLIVEFPSPILLAASGLGIYGFSGLFAMHYKRLEPAPVPQDPVSPALHWLVNAEGEPSQLTNSHGQALWGPELDRWSFGVGVILGSADGGFLINFRGMFVLELPGPRILIFVKIQIVSVLPSLGDAKLTVGILGVIDLDFNLMQITIGVLVNLEIKDILQLTVPIEIYFKLDDSHRWHFYLGTIQTKASALILNLVRAGGYFMVAGDQITGFPGENGPITLPGIAVAAGLEASIVFGDQDIGLYLQVSVGADMGVSFSPHLFIVGNIHFDGELHLFIIGIEAHGRGDVMYDSQGPTTRVHVHVCAKLDLFFFSIEGCVDFTIGSEPPPPPAPDLLRNMYLQSHSPVLTAGQGTDRPIDASLGDALVVGAAGDPPVVPIDSVPVLQMVTSPLTTGVSTFTAPLTTAPGLVGDGWFDVGERQARYTLKEIAIDPPPPASPTRPPATWRREQAPGPSGVDKNIDLALFSRIPVTASRALERSTDLDSQATLRWGNLCKRVAPPACVLWTFCRQKLGPSGQGWKLTGLAWPDPPDTQRDAPAPTRLLIQEPAPDSVGVLHGLALAGGGLPFLIPARVIGLPAPVSLQLRPSLVSAHDRLLAPAAPPASTASLEPLTRGPITSAASVDPAILECARALQLPQTEQVQVSGKLPGVEELAKERPDDQLTLVTGEADQIVLFLAFDERLLKAPVRQLDAAGKVLSEDPLVSLPHTAVTGPITGLPARWVDPQGPWAREVLPVAALLARPEFAPLMRRVVTLKPLPGCVKLQLGEGSRIGLPVPALVLGAVEICSRAEADRYANATSIQNGQVSTVTGYLNDDGVVPLLAPGTTYTVRVKYTPETRAKPTDASSPPVTPEADRVQQFRFRTDDHAPKRLDPWVLGTTPGHEERYYFYGDPLTVVFNDLAALQLFKAYGKKLFIRLRAADGVPIPQDEMKALTPIPEQVSTPYRDTLRKLIAAGLLPCVGAITGGHHGSYTSPVPLRPAMAYTLDIEPDPADPPPSAQPAYPLYRRSFVTSRFPNLAALVADVKANLIRHRPLEAQLSGLPTTGDPNDPFTAAGFTVVQATDEAIQSALRTAGAQALPGASKTGITIYWARRAGQTGYSPHAILIDAAEPLWRTRDEPRLETVLDLADPAHPPIDPAYQRVVPARVASIAMAEQGGPYLTRFVVSPSGTRTLAIVSDTFNPPAGGTLSLRIDVRRVKSDLFGITALSHTLMDLALGGKAPWEDDHA